MALIKVAEKRLAYALFQGSGTYILSVVCGQVGLYEINIALSNEAGVRASKDKKFLEELVAEISNDPQKISRKNILIQD